MATATQTPAYTHTAYITYETGGYIVSNDALDYIDSSGSRYPTKAAAYRAAHRYGYTRYNDDGVFRLIPARYRAN